MITISRKTESKTIKMTPETLKEFEKQIKESGKGPSDYLEDLVHEMSLKNLTDDAAVPVDIRRHFESDIAKLKDATGSIMETFISQMKNITVEKNRWESKLQNEIAKRDKSIESEKMLYESLYANYQQLEKSLNEKTKELEVSTKSAELYEKRLKDQEEIIENQKKNIQSLNQTIDEHAKKIEEAQNLSAVNKQLEEKVAALMADIDNSKNKHEEEITKLKELLKLETDKTVLRKEKELYDAFKEQEKQIRESVRNDVREEIRNFYLQEFRTREEELKKQLNEQLKTFEKTTKTRKAKASTKKATTKK